MRISGVGCCLIDSIYMNCSYAGETFRRLMSVNRGDGGLIEGGLVFSEDLQRFAGMPYADILSSLVGDREPDVTNLGGPAIVALVHAAQILHDRHVEVSFHGAVGTDLLAGQIRSSVANTPLKLFLKEVSRERTATTEVFDDPSQRDGKGERSFVNTIGAAGCFGPEDIPDSFYDADIVLCGGTALVPRLHDGLHTVLARAKARGCVTVVGTVYDYRNEKRDPDSPWPLGNHDAYGDIDLLVTDAEEALRLTGSDEVTEAAKRFISFGVGSLIITRGAHDMLVYSGGPVVAPHPLGHLPVSAYMDGLMASNPTLRKDTTGCGDNFVGGVLVSLARQMAKGRTSHVDMVDLCAWGAASGGFTCTYRGGMFHETHPGEKAGLIEPVVHAYLESVEARR